RRGRRACAPPERQSRYALQRGTGPGDAPCPRARGAGEVGRMSTEVQNKARRPFSMIREFHMADWFTLGNAISGTGALFSSMTYLQSGDVHRIYVAWGLALSQLLF